MIKFPLDVRFTMLAVRSPLTVWDDDRQLFFHVKLNIFKANEPIQVFADKNEVELLYSIERVKKQGSLASPRFRISDKDGSDVGEIQRRGDLSRYAIHYDLFDVNKYTAILKEQHERRNVAKSCLGAIPLLGMLVVLIFRPAYQVSTPDGTVMFSVKMHRSLIRGRFSIEQVGSPPEESQVLALLSVITMLLSEFRAVPR